MAEKPHLIVVQGAPGTGKTTLSRRLSADLGIDCFAKDTFKELIYDTVGTPESIEETKRYGRIAIRAMYVAADEYVKDSRSVMIEAPLEEKFALGDIAKIAPADQVVQVYVVCDPEIQVERFHARIMRGDRHEGHLDTTDFTAEDAREAQKRNRPLPGIETIVADTTHMNDNEYKEILARIKECIA